MKRKHNICFLISFIVSIVTISAAVGALVVALTKKRKDEEELEKYLDNSIQ